MPTILLLGAGGHARSCIDVIEQEGRFAITGLIGLSAEVGGELLGYPIVGDDLAVGALLPESDAVLVSVGQIKTAEPRVRLFNMALEQGGHFPTLVSPRAYVSRHASVGVGTIVMPGAVINAGAVVGRNCIINSQALVEHDSAVSDHCHIATGARLNSGVRVGEGAFVGSGAVIRQGVAIGAKCIVGMGQRVLRDCDSGTMVIDQ